MPLQATAENSELECEVIGSYVAALDDANFRAFHSAGTKVEGVKDAINKVLIDPRMPSDLAGEARSQIFGTAFEEWEVSFRDARVNEQNALPEAPAFEALMRDKCGRRWP